MLYSFSFFNKKKDEAKSEKMTKSEKMNVELPGAYPAHLSMFSKSSNDVNIAYATCDFDRCIICKEMKKNISYCEWGHRDICYRCLMLFPPIFYSPHHGQPLRKCPQCKELVTYISAVWDLGPERKFQNS
jgi:hypothetical protein